MALTDLQTRTRKRRVKLQLEYDVLNSRKNSYLYTLIGYLCTRIANNYKVGVKRTSMSVIRIEGMLSNSDESEIREMLNHLLDGRARYSISKLT